MNATGLPCTLVVDVPARASLVAALGDGEAKHAIERCLHRVDRAVAAGGGSVARRDAGGLVAEFERADGAIAAAVEMLARVENLPPQRGLRMTIRAGVHCAAAPAAAEPLARALAHAARPGQVLASGAVVARLGAAAARCIAPAAKTGAIDGLDGAPFAVARDAAGAAPAPLPTRAPPRLKVRHQQDILYVDANRPVVLLGRELGNDVVIADPHASRQHGRIEQRAEGYVLIDESTNGSFVCDEDGTEHCVKRGEWRIAGAGRLGCGFSANAVERDLVFFEFV